MPRSPQPRIRTLLLSILGVGLSAVVLRGALSSWGADSSGRWLAPLAATLYRAQSLATLFTTRIDMAGRVRELEQKYQDAQAALVNQDELKLQLQFYRDLANIRQQLPGDPLVAGIFSHTRVGGVRQVVINRGSADGVHLGDIVTTAHQELIGTVEQIFSQHAVIRTLGDATLEVTARVVGSAVAGLVRSGRDGSVILDLVQKDEVLVEGATVVTSGDDQYPAGLILGTVRAVDRESATLFQVVRITPAITSGIRGSVVVFRP